jgi:antiviral helicase SLH1
MKALAAEIVRKFKKRLRWLGIKVHELTGMRTVLLRSCVLRLILPGDTQMTKAEIAETQVIVTTPEKWDVVTRKPTGEGEIASVYSPVIFEPSPKQEPRS